MHIMNNAIREADALDLMGSLPDNSVDLLLTDIPYGWVNKASQGLRVIDKGDANTETFDLEIFAAEAARVTKGSGVIFCSKEQFSSLLLPFDRLGLTTRMLIWEKTNPSPMNGQHLFLSGIECAVYFRKRNATFNGHCLNTVFRFPNGRSKQHPTEKPLALFKHFIELLSNPDDLVVDPCVGSGTTAVACLELDRFYLCGDVNPEYVKLARERVSAGSGSFFE